MSSKVWIMALVETEMWLWFIASRRPFYLLQACWNCSRKKPYIYSNVSKYSSEAVSSSCNWHYTTETLALHVSRTIMPSLMLVPVKISDGICGPWSTGKFRQWCAILLSGSLISYLILFIACAHLVAKVLEARNVCWISYKCHGFLVSKSASLNILQFTTAVQLRVFQMNFYIQDDLILFICEDLHLKLE